MDSVSQILRQGFKSENVTLKQLMLLAKMDRQQTVDFLQISLPTFHRWERSGHPDPTASKLMAIMAGYLPWANWSGWEIHGVHLFAPGQSSSGVTSPQIENMAIMFQHRDSLQEENQKLQEQLDQYRQKEKAPVLTLVR